MASLCSGQPLVPQRRPEIMPVDSVRKKVILVQIDSEHWLTRGRRLPSPHFDKRPFAADPGLIVVHGISLPPGEFGGTLIDQLFTGRMPAYIADGLGLTGMRVSSHVLIDRRGRRTQYVAFDKRAWHAGLSRWQGRPNCNDYAIGIELEGTDSRPYTEAQYRTLVRLTKSLFDAYPRLAPEAIVGHNEVAPGRKTDPGGSFDWQRYLLSLI